MTKSQSVKESNDMHDWIFQLKFLKNNISELSKVMSSIFTLNNKHFIIRASLGSNKKKTKSIITQSTMILDYKNKGPTGWARNLENKI